MRHADKNRDPQGARKRAKSDSRTVNQRDFDCASDVNVGDEVQLSGVRYIVDEVTTPADYRERELHNIAAAMDQNGCHADLVCRRPRGRKLHLLRAYRNGAGVLLFRHVLSL